MNTLILQINVLYKYLQHLMISVDINLQVDHRTSPWYSNFPILLLYRKLLIFIPKHLSFL